MPRVSSTTTPASCAACGKAYANAYNLDAHLARQPLCRRWTELRPGLRDYVDAAFRLPQSDGEAAADAARCGVCGKAFSNTGNLNRHLETSAACRKWAMYRDLQPLEAFLAMGGKSAPRVGGWSEIDHAADHAIGGAVGPDGERRAMGHDARGPSSDLGSFGAFEAPRVSLCHIIWNVFLIDKQIAARPDFAEIVRENDVRYILAILPDEATYAEALGGRADDVPHHVMTYDGHTPALDAAAFDAQCERIEERRHARHNVFVFCNSGYQRSLPFLAYYLRTTHPTEVPSVERAIDLILPQVDKEGYAALRDGTVASVRALLEPLGVA